MTFFFNFRFYDCPLGLTTASVICYSFCSVIINITVAHIKYKFIINYLSVDFMHFMHLIGREPIDHSSYGGTIALRSYYPHVDWKLPTRMSAI